MRPHGPSWECYCASMSISINPTLSHAFAPVFCWGDVRANGSSYYEEILFPLAVCCNSLLATLNVRNPIRESGHGDRGVSQRQLIDLNGLTADDHKIVRLHSGGTCFTPLLTY